MESDRRHDVVSGKSDRTSGTLDDEPRSELE